MTSALETDISGRVVDDRGEPVEGMSIRLYGLLDNTQFVEGGDVRSGRAYIDREAILASNNTLGTAQTDADGRFRLSEIPNAFLAVAVKEDCSPAFAGFDETTAYVPLRAAEEQPGVEPKRAQLVALDLDRGTIRWQLDVDTPFTPATG